MALVFTPPFVQAPFDPASTLCTATGLKNDGSVAGTVIATGDADSSLITSIDLVSHDTVTQGETIFILYYDGANRSVWAGIVIAETVVATPGSPAWTYSWYPPGGPRRIPSGDTVQVGRSGSAGVISATPNGGHF